jgi:hypothetical protein
MNNRYSRTPRHSRAGGNPTFPVIPAQAGIQIACNPLDSRLRGNDGRIATLDVNSAEKPQTIRGLP